MKIFCKFLLFFLFFDFILSEAGKLLLKYQEIQVLEYQAEFNNVEVYKNNRYEYVNVWGKLCFALNYTEFDNNCRQKYKGYNNKWIVLIEKKESLDEFYKLIEKNEYLRNSISSIIYNNDTVNSNITSFTTLIPIFSLEKYQFEVLLEYDITKEIHNYFVNITYIRNNYIAINRFLFYVSILIDLILIVFNIYWYLKVFHDPNTYFQLQRTLTLFPCIRIMISFLMTYYIILENKVLNTNNENKLYKMYVDIFLQTLISLYRTFFWFILLLMAYGWQIYRNEISQRELKRFLLLYIGIYLLTYFDQILDEVVTNNFYGFTPSEFKNFLIFIIFTIIIVTVSKRSYNYLVTKYYYAREYLPQYCEPLLMKMNMIIYLTILTMAFTLSYIALIIALKVMVRSTRLLERVSVMILEIIIMMVWLIIFQPRDFPALFNDLIFENNNLEFYEIKNIKIYRVLLPSRKDLVSNFFFNNNLNQLKNNNDNNEYSNEKQIPLVIINPIISNDMEYNLMDKIAVAFEQ